MRIARARHFQKYIFKKKTKIKTQHRNSAHHKHSTHPKNFSCVIVLVRLLIIQEGIHKQKNVQPQPRDLEEKNISKAYRGIGKDGHKG